jgi:hypothetical protein
MMNRQEKQGDPQGTTSKGFFSIETRSLRILIWKAGNQELKQRRHCTLLYGLPKESSRAGLLACFIMPNDVFFSFLIS